jgi:hypothetical protein
MLPVSRLCLVSGLALLPGCVTTSSPSAIQGSQSGVFLPAVRVSVGGPGAEPPSHARSGGALELGAGLLLRLRPGTSVQSRYTYYEAPTIDSVDRVQRFELGLAQALGANAGVRAGYGTWLIESERGVGLSSIKARFSGPALALELMF